MHVPWNTVLVLARLLVHDRPRKFAHMSRRSDVVVVVVAAAVVVVTLQLRCNPDVIM